MHRVHRKPASERKCPHRSDNSVAKFHSFRCPYSRGVRRLMFSRFFELCRSSPIWTLVLMAVFFVQDGLTVSFRPHRLSMGQLPVVCSAVFRRQIYEDTEAPVVRRSRVIVVIVVIVVLLLVLLLPDTLGIVAARWSVRIDRRRWTDSKAAAHGTYPFTSLKLSWWTRDGFDRSIWSSFKNKWGPDMRGRWMWKCSFAYIEMVSIGYK